MVKVWLNGSFDILHIGHIRLINHAASLGIVRVGLDTDVRIREKKGINQFINADGIGENVDVTTTEYKQSQKARIVSTVVISGALIYAGTRKEIQNKYVRYGLIGLGVLNALANIRNFRINKDI